MSEIDPKEFGRLLERVDMLSAAVEEQGKKLDQLVVLAAQGKGALWLLSGISAMIGAIASKFMAWFGWMPR